jgi:hypothetical protein
MTRAPRRLALAGLAAMLPLVVLHLAGARACVSVLSGTYPAGLVPATAEVLGLAYVVAWAVATLAAPVLLLAAGILTAVLFLPLTSGRAYHRSGR